MDTAFKQNSNNTQEITLTSKETDYIIKTLTKTCINMSNTNYGDINTKLLSLYDIEKLKKICKLLKAKQDLIS